MTRFFKKLRGDAKSPSPPCRRLRLESLEHRVTPAVLASTPAIPSLAVLQPAVARNFAVARPHVVSSDNAALSDALDATGSRPLVPAAAVAKPGRPVARAAVSDIAPSVLAEERAAPTITETMVNGGSTQLSRVTSLMVVFDGPVTFAGPVANAFTLVRQGNTLSRQLSVPVSFNASASVVNGVTVVLLSNFTGGTTQFGSLADGQYTLTALASQISVNGQPLDGNGDGVGGDNATIVVNRLFGDINGDGRVDQNDAGLFQKAMFSPANYNNAFDFNNDGRIDIADFAQFAIRLQPPTAAVTAVQAQQLIPVSS